MLNGNNLIWFSLIVVILQFFVYHIVVFFTMTNRVSVRLLRVSDGDTIRVEEKNNSSKQHSIRFAYIDAPEMAQNFGRQARIELADKLKRSENLSIEIMPSQDRYGRTVAVVYTGNENVNMWLVKNGYAWAYEKYAPQVYIAAQEEAKKSKIGLWSTSHPEAPWDMRKRKRGQLKRLNNTKQSKKASSTTTRVKKVKGKVRKPKKIDTRVNLKKKTKVNRK